tara:strand:- start:242 stop:766 length:525 start_codon:yes stop_codon:yes gene_type:complete
MVNKKKHIFIIGMMCSGKSSLAPILSQKLNIPFIDIDIDLISILGLDIKEIFNVFSEEKFRLLESTYFLEHIKNKQHIYATGGGLVIEKNNRKALSKHGITILLNTPIEIIYQRLLQDNNESRPLFIDSPNKKNLQNIWDSRKKYYKKCADLIIDTQNKSLDTIAQEAIKYINK